MSRLSIAAAVLLLAWGASFGARCEAQELDRTVTAEDMPRIPPTPASKALETFSLAAGFQLELVAAEPLVGDPVAACFDEQGRMFVAEMHGYPFSHEPTKLNPQGGGKKDAGIIRMLVDTDGDGKIDKSTVFADQISWPTSLCCYDGGIFVIAPKYLYYLKDTDGDNVADQRDVVLEGFGRGNVQGVSNGLLWDLDNHIYFAAGRNPKSLKHRGDAILNVGSVDLRFDPKREVFEQVSGGSQFGHSIDDWGVRFICSNSNHIQQVIYPQRYLKDSPMLASRGVVRSIAADGASAQVFRKSPPEPWRIIRQKWRAADKGYRLIVKEDGSWEFQPLDPTKKMAGPPTEYPVGYFTSATGVTIYRGDAYPEEFRGNAFVGDVGGNLVHRKVLDASGVVYQARRADPGEELVASSDNWFRPVNFVNAPDGSLYVLDMYRETIEHPYSIPEDIKKFLDLSSGDNAGRIYRLVSPNMKRRAVRDLGALSNKELVRELESTNGWNRDTAQRLLFERGDLAAPAVDDLVELLNTSERPLGRLHALYCLQGLGATTLEHLKAAIGDQHPRLRAHGIRLAEQFVDQHPAAAADAIRLLRPVVSDQNEHVRFQLLLTLGHIKDSATLELLAESALQADHTPETLAAWKAAAAQNACRLASLLAANPTFRNSKTAVSLLASLAESAGLNNDPSVFGVLTKMAADGAPLTLQQQWLVGVAEGGSRRGTSLQQMLADAEDAERKQIAGFFRKAAETAADVDASAKERIAAVRMLGFAKPDAAIDSLLPLLTPRSAQALQLAAVESLQRQSAPEAAAAVIKNWRSYGPAVRRAVATGMTGRKAMVTTLLDQIASGTVKRGDLQRDTKQQLLNHPDADVKTRSQMLLGGELDSDRNRVVAAHQSVLKLNGDKTRGLNVFTKKCAVCHQVGDVGHAVAPNLSSVQNKSSADLLIAILDPNREAQPNFNVYNVLTEDGDVISGMIASESQTAVTIRKAEAKETLVLRSNIAKLIATGVSLMPEGLEKDLSQQDLADVIAFVKSIRPERK